MATPTIPNVDPKQSNPTTPPNPTNPQNPAPDSTPMEMPRRPNEPQRGDPRANPATGGTPATQSPGEKTPGCCGVGDQGDDVDTQ